ncbi:MAG: IS21 family transposase [Candidatus Eremiobacteraeota bacterium]|nr:IS21 family transposase [Candidatus Eremiobacteraeota bacterium]MCW5867578.1 IS21 family transposase [Candidatus Eremiobacteraeota bacterium]
MLDYQHVLEMMRSGLSGREIARRGVVSRNKASQIFAVVEPLGWLDPNIPMPSLDEIRDVLHQPAPVPQRVSSIEPYRDLVLEWSKELQPEQIRTKLKRQENFECSVGAIKRFLRSQGKRSPQKAVVVLSFEPGEAAQVDFGKGSELLHPVKNKMAKSYVFVMTLCDSRHMYAEIVWDQTIETWLRCHVRAFEFFGGVPRRIILDNLKSAIIKACQRDPIIQRSYYGFAESWGFQIDKCPPRSTRLEGSG